MTNNSNASPEVFGFDFQVNATIFLLLDNIKEVKAVRMEGASEDIELTMNNGSQIMAQAKGIVKGSSDFSNVRRNLKKAIETLSSADNKSVEQLILITNSKNPLKEDTSKSFFYGPPVAVGYNDLSEEAKKVIDNIVERLDVPFDKNKFQIYYFMFETDNLRTRYAVIEEKVKDFINQLNLGQVLSATELLQVWQNDLFHNGSQTDTTIKLSKKEIVWPVIVLTLGKQLPSEYIEDYDQGFINEITAQYSYLINTISEQYNTITKIIFDYNSSNYNLSMKERARKFVADKWKDYISVFSFESLNEEVQEAVTKVILAKVIQQRYLIDNISRGVSL
ncbi:MAG: hypothetical protein ACI4HM_02955 [Ruminococcus sp.]